MVGRRRRKAVAAFAVLFVTAALAAPGARGEGPADPVRGLRAADAAERAASLRAIAASDPSAIKGRASLRLVMRDLLTRDKAAEVRGLAARVMLRLEGDAAAKDVVEAMRTERDPAAERALAEAWAEAPGDGARRALGTACFDRTDDRTAALAAEALGWLPGGAGADDLVGILVAAPPWPVASGACLALARIGDARAVEWLVKHVRHADPSVRACAADSLTRLAGRDAGTDPGAWEAWWEKEKATWHAPQFVAPDAPAGKRAGSTSDRRAEGAPTWSRFFGIELRGPRVAFVIDYSQSMWGERRARAERELVDAVKGLPPGASVSVLLFNEKVWWWRDGPVPARPQEKWDLVRYLPDQETKSYTNIFDATEEALGLAGAGQEARNPAPGLDELVLLSDGVPNRGRIQDPDRIVEAVTALAAGRVKIHTVSLGPPQTTLLKRLAEANGGRYVSAPVAK